MNKKFRDQMFKKANVVAIGRGYETVRNQKTDIESLVFSVKQKVPANQLSKKDIIPPNIDGLKTDVIQTGVIRALDTNPDPTGRFRPAPGGVSIGHPNITAGTIGCYVKMNMSDDDHHILSNNHVLANSNNASIGDAIIQPGTHDGGTNPADFIAELAAFEPIKIIDLESFCPTAKIISNLFNFLAKITGHATRFKAFDSVIPENLIDAAVAGPVDPEDVNEGILNIGAPTGISDVAIGDTVIKSGRTTGFTKGIVSQVDVAVNVQYGEMAIARFVDQVMIESNSDKSFSAGGDSGSAILNVDKKLVGLLFAGSESVTIGNRIQNVFELLDLSL